MNREGTRVDRRSSLFFGLSQELLNSREYRMQRFF